MKVLWCYSYLVCFFFFFGGGGGGGVKVYGMLCRFDVKMRGVVACCLPPPVLFIPLKRIWVLTCG